MSQSTSLRRYPISFLVLCGLGGLVGLPGIVSLAGLGGEIHPLLDDPMAGLALFVSALALIGSGLFPFFIMRLRRAEEGGEK